MTAPGCSKPVSDERSIIQRGLTEDYICKAGGANVTIRFVDPSVNSASADEWQGGTWLGVTYLNSSKEQFPDVQIGDVLLIRLAKVSHLTACTRRRPFTLTASRKTVSYSTYTRLSVFSDQVCDWVCLPADVVRGLPEAALFEPIHANAFRTCPGT